LAEAQLRDKQQFEKESVATAAIPEMARVLAPCGANLNSFKTACVDTDSLCSTPVYAFLF
jgi:hypothetical protein